VKHQTVRK